MGANSQECRVQDCDPYSKTCRWVLLVAHRVLKLLCQKLTMEKWHRWCCAGGCRGSEKWGSWVWHLHVAFRPPWTHFWQHNSVQRALSRPTPWASKHVSIPWRSTLLQNITSLGSLQFWHSRRFQQPGQKNLISPEVFELLIGFEGQTHIRSKADYLPNL